MNLDEIRELIHLMKDAGLTEIDIQSGDTHVKLKAEGGPLPQPMQQAPHSVHVYPHPNTIPMPITQFPPMQHGILPPPPEQPGGLHPGLVPEPKTPDHDPGVVITSPIVGIFYAAPAPDKPPFVADGDKIDENTVLCIIEAMKVMNEIKAETSGTVREVLVMNAQSVEYGQPLFVIDPA